MTVVAFVIILPFTGSIDVEKTSAVGVIEKASLFFTAETEFLWKATLIGVVLAVLVMLYFALFELKLRQTIGKMIMRLEVRSTFGELTAPRALLRNWTKFSSVLLFLDTLYMFLTRTHQRCFERLSKTEVIFMPKSERRIR